MWVLTMGVKNEKLTQGEHYANVLDGELHPKVNFPDF